MTDVDDDVLPIEMADDDDAMPDLVDASGRSLLSTMPRMVPSASGRSEEAPFQSVSRKRKRGVQDVEMRDQQEGNDDMADENAAGRKQKRKQSSATLTGLDVETRRISVPPHRYTPLKEQWRKLVEPITKQLHLRIRFNVRRRQVELQVPPVAAMDDGRAVDVGHLQKAEDFVRAFVLGFEVDDALALVRLDDLFVESFEINDVKPLKGEHLSRAIGRIAGKDGRTKLAIENATKTRIVLADSKIHLLGAFQNIAVARSAICSLILGSPPSKIYGNLRSLASRTSERM